MQNEKSYINHYDEFLHILDFEIIFKSQIGVGALLVLVFLSKNIYLYLIDFNQLYRKQDFIYVENYIVYMTSHCKLCDKSICTKSRHKLFKSKTHISSNESIMRRYFILNPSFDEVDEIVREKVNNQNKKYEEYDLRCLIKLLTTTNRIR